MNLPGYRVDPGAMARFGRRCGVAIISGALGLAAALVAIFSVEQFLLAIAVIFLPRIAGIGVERIGTCLTASGVRRFWMTAHATSPRGRNAWNRASIR